eukprot:587771-Alexandrium_andersonii.AAC.1
MQHTSDELAKGAREDPAVALGLDALCEGTAEQAVEEPRQEGFDALGDVTAEQAVEEPRQEALE